MNQRIEEILKFALVNKASDIHLMFGVSPKIRVNGELRNVDGFTEVDNNLTEEMVLSLLTDKQKEDFKNQRELDFSFESAENRFRCNVYFQKGSPACALRLISSQIPAFEELGIPDILRTFANYKQGFILVTGPTGHGKSTTVAAILDEINRTRATHIVTIEDPVEYLIKPDKSIISQRELGNDTNSFDLSLRSCLRQDPNVVFVGEMRDLESISSALTIAETGHLVFSVLHTNSASQTIDRIIDVFPAESKDEIRVQLASAITAIVSQRLVPTINGERTPAFEILIATPAVKNIIREGKTFMIDNIIQTSADLGMVSLETSLAKLVLAGKITEEVALSFCTSQTDLENKLRRQKI